ncbi:COG3014 family protein [Corallococcus soli]|uniref:COG3014 family protein n=1 Tax=Corallococcus soli TaxID=2710757 RepID=UPI0034E2A72E
MSNVSDIASRASRATVRQGVARWGLLFVTALGLLSGCASDYVARTAAARLAYQASDYPRALRELEDEEKGAPQRDQLLLMLDRGMVLHAAGQWEASTKVLAEADRLVGELDITSVSEEAGVLLSNERRRAYRGEDFEKLMISVLQALNYAQLGRDEDALVEVRRVNERLEKMILEEKKPYEQLAIARYLGGVLYEDQREWDSAFIDYMKAYELEPRLGGLVEPLLRLAKKTGRDDAYAMLSQKFPDVEHSPPGPEDGQLVVVVEAGLSPEKTSASRDYNDSGELISVPVYRDRGGTPAVRVAVGDRSERAVTVTSLSRVAQVHLNDRIGRMLAKQLAGAVAKAGVAAGVGALTKSKELGVLTFLLLNAGNQPDLRSWLSLPAEFQVARFRLAPGKHTVQVDAPGRPTTHAVEVKPGRVAVLVVRSY